MVKNMNENSRWIYLSPHLDDAVLSCGGLIWQQVQNGLRVEIWTIFAGSPPAGELTPFARSLHQRWQGGNDPAAARRHEDAEACRVLSAGCRHFDFPDCIYRFDEAGLPVIRREEDLFQPEYRGEMACSQQLAQRLAHELPDDAILALPVAFGNHIDHQMVRRLAGFLPHPVWLYADYPYAADDPAAMQNWLNLPGETYRLEVASAGLEKWQAAVAAYETQISTFWKSLDEMRRKMEAYCRSGAGSLLRRA